MNSPGSARSSSSMPPTREVPKMCMSCGCGEANVRHKPGDIVMDDLDRAAHNHDLSREQVAENIQRAIK